MPAPETWTAPGLLDYFQEVDATADRRFAFILGAGASVQSGIPVANRLVANWLQELHAREDHERRPLAQWATAERLRIPGFEHARAVEWYPQVFARRFEHRPDEGYAYLERILHGKDPSFGYSVLAQILAGTRHRAIITTNFDNLVADALAIYTNQLPFVCGHESLAAFVRPNPRRPLIVKIHRDLLLAPKNRSEELAALPEPLAAVLRALLAGFTPIVIGYGGNDGSLMNFLRDIPPGEIPGGIYWCYWARGGLPIDTALEVVERHRGAIVPIDGFDELMAMLGHRLNFPRMDQVIEQRARERVQRYRSSFEAFQQRLQPTSEAPPTPVPSPELALEDADEAEAGIVEDDRTLHEPAPPVPAPAQPVPSASSSGPVASDRSSPRSGALEAPARSAQPLGPLLSSRTDGPRRSPSPVLPARPDTPRGEPVLQARSDTPTSEPVLPARSDTTRGDPARSLRSDTPRGAPATPAPPHSLTPEPGLSPRSGASRSPSPAPVPSASPTRDDARAEAVTRSTAPRSEPRRPHEAEAEEARASSFAIHIEHETDTPIDLALSVDTAPVQAALAALVPADAQADWWTLKLLADREPVPHRRIAAYQAALDRFPGQSELRRGLAFHLALAGAFTEAEHLFHALIADQPGDAGLHLDLAVLAALNRDFIRAESLADEAWRLTRAGERDDAVIAAVAFVRGLLARLQHQDDTAALRVLRGVLRTTAIQPGGLTPMLAVVVASLDRRGLVLDRPSHRLYHRLLACLTGQATPESLEANQRWAELTPLAPEAAWPDPP
jgi:hypothetical protein